MLQAALFALIVASNLGAVFTILAALAGIMWANLIKRCAPQVGQYALMSRMHANIRSYVSIHNENLALLDISRLVDLHHSSVYINHSLIRPQ